ncbi:hypothetical protein [Streptomyces sp. NPDC058373]|uniref:GH39 family glycosyl hydrolase n=1 Tax=Streptomyces sp. NPDC058373 TaxID=3346465 RepID=UPI00365DA0CE
MRHHGGQHRPAGRVRPALLVAVAALALALLAALLAARSGGQPAPLAPPAEVGWGFTHTQYSADAGEDRAVRRARETLKGTGLPQVQHLMGWGAANPEPRPGQYDFAAMDRRIALAAETGATPAVTLCCAPDWMKGGDQESGRTDWSAASLERAPAPEHYADFARLAATTARRYPQVRHFIVWNEFKGFWNEAEGRWDHEGYTELYNQVRRALKEVDPALRVGGPYLVMDSFAPGRTDGASREVRGAWGALDRRTVDAFRHWKYPVGQRLEQVGQVLRLVHGRNDHAHRRGDREMRGDTAIGARNAGGGAVLCGTVGRRYGQRIPARYCRLKKSHGSVPSRPAGRPAGRPGTVSGAKGGVAHAAVPVADRGHRA